MSKDQNKFPEMRCKLEAALYQYERGHYSKANNIASIIIDMTYKLLIGINKLVMIENMHTLS